MTTPTRNGSVYRLVSNASVEQARQAGIDDAWQIRSDNRLVAAL